MLARELGRGADDFFDGFFDIDLEKHTHNAVATDHNKETAKFRLEKNNKREHPDISEGVENPPHRFEIKYLRGKGEADDKHEADEDLRGNRSAHNKVQLIADERDEADIDDVDERDGDEADVE
jgi:hypothetical protein